MVKILIHKNITIGYYIWIISFQNDRRYFHSLFSRIRIKPISQYEKNTETVYKENLMPTKLFIIINDKTIRSAKCKNLNHCILRKKLKETIILYKYNALCLDLSTV